MSRLLLLATAAVLLCAIWTGTCPAFAKPSPRWTERHAESALLSRPNIAYADCLPLDNNGRRFQCLIEYTSGKDRFLELFPRRDGFTVREYEPA